MFRPQTSLRTEQSCQANAKIVLTTITLIVPATVMKHADPKLFSLATNQLIHVSRAAPVVRGLRGLGRHVEVADEGPLQAGGLLRPAQPRLG